MSELAERISGALRSGVPGTVAVMGEVSGVRERTHLYFDIKDESSVVSCVMFATAARRLAAPITGGGRFVLWGRVEFYKPQGRVSMIVDRAEPAGAGPLDAQFRALCAELRELGWFSVERKRPLPLLPRAVGVITSKSGAALQDVRDTVRRRCPGVRLVLVDTRVQGPGAARDLAASVRRLGRLGPTFGLDVILVTRGGGSQEDLWAFNDRELARAIVESPIPVVAAIGHETDTTIAELVADVRGATPTQAAMLIVPDARAMLRQVVDRAERLERSVRVVLRHHRDQLRLAERHPVLRDPRTLTAAIADRLRTAASELSRAAGRAVEEDRAETDRAALRLEACSPRSRHQLGLARLALLRGRLERAAGVRVSSARGVVEGASRELAGVGPVSVLGRGFSITLRQDGGVVRSVRDVAAGETIRTRVADGTIRSVVGSAAGRSQRKSGPEAPQLDLFASDS